MAGKQRKSPTTESLLKDYTLQPVDKLIPYASNARTHSEVQIEKIAESIKEFGFINPVVVDAKGGIIAGHGRVLAAKKIGLSQVPTLVVSDLTESQKKAYILADNRLALDAGWDKELLRIELQTLLDSEFDALMTGFSQDEIDVLLYPTRNIAADPDQTPPLSVEAKTKEGDLYILGDHRLYCGDSTNRQHVNRLLDGAKPLLMVTDPPYGVNYDAAWRDGHDLNLGKGFDGKSNRATGKVHNDNRADWKDAWDLFPGDVAYVWHGGIHTTVVANSLIASKFKLRSQIIWVKQHFVFGRGDYHWQHEPCWYAVRDGAKGHYCGGRKQTTVWEINNNNPFGTGSEKEEKTGHSTQKPVECMKRPIENNSKLYDAVYDPFLGSGTTIIAAEMTGRKCYGLELDPLYCDLIVRRWEEFTGQKAELIRG